MHVDGVYRFSLDAYQVTDLGIKAGEDIDKSQLADLENESVFGKLYTRALEYTMIRPHSGREIRDYLLRKTKDRQIRSRHTGEMKTIKGVEEGVVDRVYRRLSEKGYVDDQKFADFWVNNRHLRKGISYQKLRSELYAKGVSSEIIDVALEASDRDEAQELQKLIEKKAARYSDQKKLTMYLQRQGFRYGDIQKAIDESS